MIVIQSDENDCSIADYTLIDPARADLGSLGLRCFSHPEYLYPLSRYQEGLVTEVVPEHRLDRVVVADIGGIPADLAGMDPTIILADPRTAERMDPLSPNLVPGCENGWVAYPPPRRIEMVEPFYASGNATVHVHGRSQRRG